MFAKPIFQSSDSRSVKGYLRIAAVALLALFLLPVLVKSAAQEFAPQTTIGLQLFVGSLGLLLAHIATKGNFTYSRSEWLRIIAMALLGVTVFRAFARSALTVSLSNSLSNLGVLVLLATTPVLVCVLSTLLKWYSLTEWGWLAAVLSFTGVLVSIGSLNFGLNQYVILLSLSAAFALAGYTLLAESLLEQHSILKVTATSTAIGTLPLFALSFGSLVRQGWSGTDIYLLTQGFTVGLGYLAWNYAVRRIGGLRTAVYANLAVVVSGYTYFLLLAPLGAIAGATLLVISALSLRRWAFKAHGAG